jgi:hypothetical protein
MNDETKELQPTDDKPWAYLLFAFDGDSVRIGHGESVEEAQEWKIDQGDFSQIMKAAKAFYMAALNSGVTSDN